jgi:hypothetical protein
MISTLSKVVVFTGIVLSLMPIIGFNIWFGFSLLLTFALHDPIAALLSVVCVAAIGVIYFPPTNPFKE